VSEPNIRSAPHADDLGECGLRRTRRPLGCLIEIAETLVLTIVIFWSIQTFVAQPFQVEQVSMRSTLEPGNYVLIDKLTPRMSAYERGDIVVFMPFLRGDSCTVSPSQDAPADETPYIKRVIGVPGDIVELVGGRVFINGELVNEPYVHGVATEPLGTDKSWTVEPDRLFVLGDNRDESVDSRSQSIGQVCRSDVIGRAVLRYWPITALSLLGRPDYGPENNVTSATGP
jgi:signal peptidase I